MYKVHGAIEESRQTSARGVSHAIVGQGGLVVDVLAFWDWRDLRFSHLAIP